MAELIQAINKFRRKLCTETITHVAEEIADVEIMLEQYKMIFYQESLVKEIKKDKLQRLAERLKEADEKLLMSECQQDNDTLTKAAVVTEGESLQELVDRAYPQNLTYAADAVSYTHLELQSGQKLFGIRSCLHSICERAVERRI